MSRMRKKHHLKTLSNLIRIFLRVECNHRQHKRVEIENTLPIYHAAVLVEEIRRHSNPIQLKTDLSIIRLSPCKIDGLVGTLVDRERVLALAILTKSTQHYTLLRVGWWRSYVHSRSPRVVFYPRQRNCPYSFIANMSQIMINFTLLAVTTRLRSAWSR